MRGQRGYTRATLPAEMARHRYWPSIDPTALEAKDLTRFEKLKRAVEGYLNGEKARDLLEQLELTYEDLYRAVRRCTTRHEDGLLFGWRALIPGIRVKRYTRSNPVRIREGGHLGGYAGALQVCFKRHPGIEAKFRKYLRTGKPEDGGKESRVTQQSAHAYFLELCQKDGVPEYGWPFATWQLGKSAIRDYVLRFFDENYEAIVEAQFGEIAKIKAGTGTGHKSRLVATFPYDVVEVDEHKAHFLGAIGIPTPSGMRYRPISRVILITVTDRRSAEVLGYHAVFRREATAEDVLAAVHNALQPWRPREFFLKGLRYDEGAGFPSGRLDCLAACGWGSLLLDNALIHLADDVLGRLRDMVGCDVNFGPTGHPERRAIGELVFKRLSDQGFTRVESTTGSNVTDALRRDPERKACRTRLHMHAVLDLVELAIAHYNGEVSKHTHGASGLDFIEQLVTDEEIGFLLPRLPTLPAHIAPLNIHIMGANITGDKKKGVRPRIYALGTYYTSPDFSKRFGLIGDGVRLHVNPDDVSTIRAFSENGTFLGELNCADEWGDEPHSLEARRQISALIAAGKLERQRGESWVRAFLRALKEEAAAERGGERKVSRAGTRLAEELRKRANDPVPPLPAAANDGDAGSTPPRSRSDSSLGDVPTGGIESDAYEGLPLVLPMKIKAVN